MYDDYDRYRYPYGLRRFDSPCGILIRLFFSLIL